MCFCVCMWYRHLQGSLVYHHRLSIPEASSRGPARREPWSYKSSAWIGLCTSHGWIMPSPHTWQHLPGQWRAPGKISFMRMSVNGKYLTGCNLNAGEITQKSYETSLIKKLLTPHFSSPDIETRWYSLSIGICLPLKPSSTVSTLASFINLKRYRPRKGV